MDKTCGSPDCNHVFCVAQRKEVAEKHEKAVNDIASAIKQVMKVQPQLLYEAAVKAYSELAVDCLTEQFKEDNTPEKQKRTVLAPALCAELAKLLLNSGNASMTNDHIASMVAFMQLGKNS